MFNIIGKEPSAHGEQMPVWNLHQIGPKFSGKNLCCHFVTTQCGCTLGPNCDKVHINDQMQLEALSTADLQQVKKLYTGRHAVRPGECVRDRGPHIGRAELCQDAAVDVLDQ